MIKIRGTCQSANLNDLLVSVGPRNFGLINCDPVALFGGVSTFENIGMEMRKQSIVDAMTSRCYLKMIMDNIGICSNGIRHGILSGEGQSHFVFPGIDIHRGRDAANLLPAIKSPRKRSRISAGASQSLPTK